MELHRYVKPVVTPSQMHQYRGLIFLSFLCGHASARHRLRENGVNLFIRRGAIRDVVEAMVAGAAADLREELKPLLKSRLNFSDIFQLSLADARGEPGDVVNETILVDVNGLVGSI